MKIGLSQVVLCVFLLSLIIPSEIIPLLFPGSIRVLNYEDKLTKVILRVGYPSCNLTSYKKSALIHKSAEQVHEFFNQHDIVGKKIKY